MEHQRRQNGTWRAPKAKGPEEKGWWKEIEILLVKVTPVGFEPTPMKTTALTLRLRPLGHSVFAVTSSRHQNI